MPKRLLRIAFLAMPVVALTAAFVTACGDDDASPGQPDASTEAGTDANGNVPDGNTGADTGTDAGPGDAGTDATGDADAALPALCLTYSNAPFQGDASAGEGAFPRYELIASRALHTGAKCADNSCEVSELFTTAFDGPTVYQCLGYQLAALAGCTVAGQPMNYNTAMDTDFTLPCVVDGGPGNIALGFRDPPGTYTANDVAFVADLVKQAAVATGLSASDADRLKALYLSQRASVLGPDAGDAGDAGFSNSTCP